MIYFIVTTSIFNDCLIRKEQYICGINKLKQITQELLSGKYKIIVVENNGKRETFLDNLGCEVYYTNNNFSESEKGLKELQDVLDCIQEYDIKDDDFIVKMTGRYILNDDSEFMHVIKDIYNTKYQCVIRYGCFGQSALDYKVNDCITGLIGMSCLYIKQIEKPNSSECIEWKWAGVTDLINSDKICIVNSLGINICPGSNTYYAV